MIIIPDQDHRVRELWEGLLELAAEHPDGWTLIGAQGLERSEPVEIQVGDRMGAVQRPNLLGAILLKARAVGVDDVPTSQREVASRAETRSV